MNASSLCLASSLQALNHLTSAIWESLVLRKEKMAKAVDTLQNEGITVLPLFVSVDPKRDSLAIIKDYLKGVFLSFHAS